MQIKLVYKTIETQLVHLIPALKYSARKYWKEEGSPGQDCGPYIFFSDVLNPFLLTLLYMRSTPPRDRLLSQCYGTLDLMLTSADKNVRDLGYIEWLEGRSHWWLKQSESFLGPTALLELDKYRPQWRSMIKDPNQTKQREQLHNDRLDVRGAVARELKLRRIDIPGQDAASAI